MGTTTNSRGNVRTAARGFSFKSPLTNDIPDGFIYFDSTEVLGFDLCRG
jgi:hypothetical protein